MMKNGSKLEASIYGGTGVQSALAKQPDTIPEKFEVGSLNTPAIATKVNSCFVIIAIVGIVAYLEDIYYIFKNK